MLQFVPLIFRALPNSDGDSVRHGCDMERTCSAKGHVRFTPVLWTVFKADSRFAAEGQVRQLILFASDPNIRANVFAPRWAPYFVSAA
jgi:hypothetical protein